MTAAVSTTRAERFRKPSSSAIEGSLDRADPVVAAAESYSLRTLM
jgi:hypothetical protein